MTDEQWTNRLNALVVTANAKDAEIAELRAAVQRIANECAAILPAPPDEVWLDHAPGPEAAA